MQSSKEFIRATEKKAFDLKHRNIINNNIGKYNEAVSRGKQQFDAYELARRRASFAKWRAIENLDKLLLDFEANIQRKGAQVIWCVDAAEAQQQLMTILRKHKAQSVVKSKSMATEEIGLNELLEKNKIECVETDLGEYIQQLDGEKPYHIVTPAMHKSKGDIAKLFHEKLGTPLDYSPEEMSNHARMVLREKYLKAEVGITGANFLLADTGSVCVTENEGNARLTTSFPETHIVIAGIEKVLPSYTDLQLFLPLLATAGTGQKITAYNSIFSGPRQEGETDGPRNMYVLLIDNGRTQLLAKHEQRQALHCIRCGACLNACPIYKNIGGHSYQTTYSGPIGSVITPHLKNLEEYKHLSYSSSLCGNCTEVCPVKINLHELLLINRRDAVIENLNTWTENQGWKVWKWAMMKRNRFNQSGDTKNRLLRFMFSGIWGNRRTLPEVAPKSFYELWKENN